MNGIHPTWELPFTNSSVVVAPMLPIFSFHTCCTPPSNVSLDMGKSGPPRSRCNHHRNRGDRFPGQLLWIGEPIHYAIRQWLLCPDRGEEYCDERVCVCLCVCLSAMISSEIHVRSSSHFCACYLWQCLSSGGVFIDVVIFSHKLRLLDVSARLRQWGSRSLAWHWLGPLQRSWRLRLLLAVRAN